MLLHKCYCDCYFNNGLQYKTKIINITNDNNNNYVVFILLVLSLLVLLLCLIALTFICGLVSPQFEIN